MVAFTGIDVIREANNGTLSTVLATDPSIIHQGNWWGVFRLLSDLTPKTLTFPGGSRQAFDDGILTNSLYSFHFNVTLNPGVSPLLPIGLVMDWEKGLPDVNLPPSARKVIPLKTLTLDNGTTVYPLSAVELAPLNAARRNGRWNGELWLRMGPFPPGSHFFDATQPFVTTEQSAITGLSGAEYVRDRRRGVASGLIEDFKTGELVAADLAVEDPFTGQLVHPKNVDPPDTTR